MKTKTIILSLICLIGLTACTSFSKDTTTQESARQQTIASSDLKVGNQEQINVLLTNLNEQLDDINKELKSFKNDPKTYTENNVKKLQHQTTSMESTLSSLEKIAGSDAEHITSKANKDLFQDYQKRVFSMANSMKELPTEFYGTTSSK